MGRKSRSRSSVELTERGQSVFDYSIGVSVFLVVVIGVLVFVPSAFSGLGEQEVGGSDDNLVAERGADFLANVAFSSGRSRAGFNVSCTLLFFEESESHRDIFTSPADCGYEQGAPLAANLSLDARQPFNVTIEEYSSREHLCWSRSDSEVKQKSSCGSADTVFTAGSAAETNDRPAVAERFGYLSGDRVYVVVRAW